jgi:predicted HTH domain antitoxin
MDTTLEIVLPRDFVTLLGSQYQAEQAVKEFAILGLYQEGRLSAGKAAELLGLTPRGFVALLARKGIDYFRFGTRERAEEVAAAQSGKPGRG